MVWPNPDDINAAMMDSELRNQMPVSAFADTPMQYMLNMDLEGAFPFCRLTAIGAMMGKATNSLEVAEKMIEAGMNIAILNLNFGTMEEHIAMIEKLKEATNNYGQKQGTTYPLNIAISLSGKKIRTGKLSLIYEDCVRMRVDDIVRLTTDDTYKDRCSNTTIFVNYSGFANQLKKGDIVLIDNEEIMMRVEVVSYGTVTCKVERGGNLGSFKDVVVPHRCTDMPNFSEKDIEHINMAIQHKLHMVIISFVNNADAITECRDIMGRKGKHMSVVASIETAEGWKNFDQILEVASGIIISRQQLGCEINPSKMLVLQKEMIARANMACKPVLISTHILSSMRYDTTCYQSELLDISNCILDGADGLILSAVTAVGVNPVNAVKTLSHTCKESEICVWSKQIYYDLLEKTEKGCSASMGVALGAVLAAHSTCASTIIVLTLSGTSAEMIAKFRPRCPILAITKKIHVATKLQMFRGIIPLVYEKKREADWQMYINRRQDFAVRWAVKRGFVQLGDPIVSIFGHKTGSGNTSSFKVTYASYIYSEENHDQKHD